MANYIVDITVALKGSEKITRFNKQLETTSKQIKAVNELVKVQESSVGALVKSFDNLSSNLALAKSNFNAVASSTKLQKKAARELIAAEKELNKELKEREKLLQSITLTGQRSSLMPGRSRTLLGQSVTPKGGASGRSRQILRENQEVQEALARMNQRDMKLRGQSSPIRPASSIAEDGTGSLLGQSVNIEKSLRERMAIQDKLFQMEIGQTQAAKERTKQLNKQNVELRRMKVANREALFTQHSAPIGPGQASPIMQGPQVSMEVQESIMESQRRKRRNDRLLRVRRGRDLQNRNSQARSNAIIGGAFPLLFGQGLGASAFGAAGGFAGGKKGGQFGFAFSLLGTVVGAQFDKLAQSARQLGEALRNPIKNMDMLVTKMGQANTPFGDTVETLKSLGLEAVAAGQVLDNFNKTFGTNKTSLAQLGEESIRFTNELQKLGTGITLFVAGPLTFFLEKINAALGFKTVDSIRDEARAQAIKEERIKLGVLEPDGSRGPLFFAKQLVEGKKGGAPLRNQPQVIDRANELFEQKMNEAGLGGQAGTRDFSNENLQRIIKESRDFELLTMQNQLDIEKQSLTMRSEDLNVLKRRMDVLKIEEKLKVKGLVDTKIMTAEQLKAHEFAIDKLEIEKQISDELLKQSIIMADPMQAALVDLNKEMAKFNDLRFQAVEFAKAFGGAFEESFKGIVKGTMSVQDAFRNMFMRIADHFLDMAAKMMANQLQRGLLGLLGNAFGGGLGGALGGGGSSFRTDLGGMISAPMLDPVPGLKFANGGRPPVGRASIVGERGPELFVPDRAGTIVPNNAMGGSTNIVINVDASGSSVEGDEEQANAFGSAIATAIQSELIKQKRPGGLLA